MSDKVSRGERVVAAFAERWPLCFSHERPFVPLKVGIHADIIAAGGFDEADVRRGLAWYVHRSRYISAVIKGGDRIDLDGNVVGRITEAEREDAAERMAARKAAMAARAAAKPAARAASPSNPGPAAKPVVKEPAKAAEAPVKAPGPKRLSLADLRAAAIARRAGSLGAA
jgi:ProP effector